MATKEEFDKAIEEMPDEKVPQKLTGDRIFDAVVMSDKLQESNALGELGEISVETSGQTQELLNSMSYNDPDAFVDDYATMKTSERNSIKEKLYANDVKDVEDIAAYSAAAKLLKEVDFTKSINFAENFKRNIHVAKKLGDEGIQKAFFATGALPAAMQLNNLHKNYTELVDIFNAEYFWYDYKRLTDSNEVTKEELEEARKSWEDVGITGDKSVPLSKKLKTKSDMVNYAYSRQKWLHDEYGYPADYTPGQFDPDMGSGAVEGMYPIVSGVLTATSAPVAATSKLAYAFGKAAYGFSGFMWEGPTMEGLDTMIEEMDEWHPALQAGAGLAAVVILVPRLEKLLAKLTIGGTKLGIKGSIATGKAVIKPGNTLQQLIRLAKNGDLKTSDQIEDLIYSAIKNKKEGSHLSKLVPSISNGVDSADNELAYLIPKTQWNMESVGYVEFKASDLTVQKAALKHLEFENFKSLTQDANNKRTFSSFKELIAEAEEADDFDRMAELVGSQIDEAYERTNNIIDATKNYVPDAKPNWYHRVVLGTLPRELKQAGLYNINAITSQGNAIVANAQKVYGSIEKLLVPHPLFPKHNLRKFNELVRLADDSAEDLLDGFIKSDTLDSRVKLSLLRYRKLNDVLHGHANKAVSDILNKDGILQHGENTLVRILDKEEGLMRNINTGEEFIGAMDNVGPVKNAIPYSPNFSHRHMEDNSYFVGLNNIKTGKHSILDARKSGLSAHKFKRELLNNPEVTKENTVVVYKAGGNQNAELMKGKHATVTNSPKDAFIGDAEKFLDMMNDLGLGSLPKNMIAIEDDIREMYGIDRATKGKPSLLKKMTRTREEALSAVGDVKESFRAYTPIITKAIMEKPYIEKYKTEFMKKYGKYLEGDNPNYTAKLLVPSNVDPSGDVQRVGRLLQGQIKNMDRVPNPTMVAAQQRFDEMIYKLYSSDNRLMRGMGAIWDAQNKHIPLIPLARNAGHIMSLAFQADQILIQGSFLHFGMVAHGDTLLQNPSLMKSLATDTTAVASYMSLRQSGLHKFMNLNKYQKSFLAEIDNGGYLSDILGTEAGTGKGLIRHITDAGMWPVKKGEEINKLGNIQLAFFEAANQGLKVGTKEHEMFVATHFPKYSQILNHLTNAPLTTSPFTSWNIGMFKKFNLAYFDQFWFNDLKSKSVMGTAAKRIALASAGYSMYGTAGIPGMNEPGEMIKSVENKLLPVYINQVMEGLRAVENFNRDDMQEYVDDLYPDSKADRDAEMKLFDESYEAKQAGYKKLGNLKVNDLFKGIQDGESMNSFDAMRKVVMHMVDFEGLAGNAAVNVGWKSLYGQLINYGVGSFGGPFANNLYKAHLGTAVANVTDAIAKSSDYGLEPATKIAKAEARRVLNNLFPAPANTAEGLYMFHKLLRLEGAEELKDKDGNNVSFVDIFDDPSIELDIPYTYNKSGLSSTFFKPTSTIADMGMRVSGMESYSVREEKRVYREINNHFNKVLAPQIDRMADINQYMNATGDSGFALELLIGYNAFLELKYGHTPIAELAQNMLIQRVNYYENISTGANKAKRVIDKTMYNDVIDTIRRKH